MAGDAFKLTKRLLQPWGQSFDKRQRNSNYKLSSGLVVLTELVLMVWLVVLLIENAFGILANSITERKKSKSG